MRVLYLPFMDIRGQSPRYRAFWPAEALRRAGVEARCVPWPRCRRADLEWADVTVFERPANAFARPWWRDWPWPTAGLRRRRLAALWEAARARGPVGYDLDDLVFVPGHERGRPDIAAWQVEHLGRADFLLTSTEALRAHLREFNGRVEVVPNCLDAAAFGAPGPRPGRRPVRLGWACGATHREDEPLFLEIAEALAARRRGEIAFVLWGAPSESAVRRLARSPAPVHTLPMCVWTEGPLRWTEFDINLIPLADTPLNACKSAVHWLEGSVVGLPSVASAVGEFASVIAHGETGLLARSVGEWVEAVERLIDGPQERRAVAERARAAVLGTRTLDQQGPLLRRALERISEQTRRGRRGS